MTKNIQLTKNFTLDELFISTEFPELGDNPPEKSDKTLQAALFLLCEMVLQPVRDFIKEPMIITSGYRSEALNDALRGDKYKTAKYSLHSLGIAADFTLRGDKRKLTTAYAFILNELRNIHGQVFLYKDSEGALINIHVSLKAVGHPQSSGVKIVKRGG